MRSYAQRPPRTGYMITQSNTTYLYPIQYVEEVLQTTTIPHRYDGVHIVCPNYETLKDLYYAIWLRTSIANPASNPGFSLGVGTLLQDYGREIYIQTEDNTFFIHWRNVKQLTNQTDLPVGGDSPNGIIGFIVVDTSYGNNDTPIPDFNIFDRAYAARIG